MWRIVLLSIAVQLAACDKVDKNRQVLPPDINISIKDTSLHHINGIWKYKGKDFNGYVLEKDSDKIKAKIPVINGKENGVALGWYNSGHKKYERHFKEGNREGVHKGWYENGILAFEYHFHEDKYEGTQMSWFETGHIWQKLNYQNGYEEGKQKSWNDSGRVINNFTVKDRKLYGVIGRFDCMSVYKKE